MYTIPVILCSFAAQPTIIPIYIELESKSPNDMWVVMVMGFSITSLVYMVISSFGYFTFLFDTSPNFLHNYHQNFHVLFSAVGLCFVCSLAIPLFIHAARRSIATLFFNYCRKEAVLEKTLLHNYEKCSAAR